MTRHENRTSRMSSSQAGPAIVRSAAVLGRRVVVLYLLRQGSCAPRVPGSCGRHPVTPRESEYTILYVFIISFFLKGKIFKKFILLFVFENITRINILYQFSNGSRRVCITGTNVITKCIDPIKSTERWKLTQLKHPTKSSHWILLPFLSPSPTLIFSHPRVQVSIKI